MKTFEQASIVLWLTEAMRQRGSWTGETHIQKATYFLQHLLQLPTDFEFVLYKHGPFSFDLRATLTFMEAEDLVHWQPRSYPYGPSLQPGPDSYFLRRHYGEFVRGYEPQIEFIAETLASKDVKDLERLATALYVTLENNPTERSARLSALKPHVSIDEARKAVEELDSISADAIGRGLTTALSRYSLAAG
jgi:hypothetical protein